MILVILTAFVAVCGAAKLDNTYLPPLSAKTAGGSAGSLLAPLDGSNKGLPSGSFTNDVQGVVVDAVNPGTRTSGHEPTGLGAPRPSYGSKDSRVGEAAFSGSVNTRIAPGFDSFVKSGDVQAHKANGNTLKFTSDVGLENYSYGFETDNGISVGENGEAADGVKAQGGYSYQGDDGKTYSVSYTADEGGYKPQGEHLPTSPPIPDEILISLEKNAKEEAAGHVDDGSYDAQKYNDEGDYSSNGSGNNNGRLTIGSGVATSGGSQVSQSSHRPTSGVLVGAYKPSTVATHSSQGSSGQGFSQSSTIGGQAGSNYGNSLSHGSSSHGAHAGLSSHSTENRFGVQPTNSEGNHAHGQASIGGSILRSPSFVDGASAFSSAVTRGPGSASAFASSGPLSSGLKNNNLPTLNSFQTAGQHLHGSESSFGTSLPAPSTATASASVSGVQNSGSHAQSYSPNLPSSASASSSVSGNQLSYGSNQAAHSFGSSPTPANSASSTHTGAVDVNYASSIQKPFSGQQQGIDNSYIYKHPSKPFVTPSAKPSSQYTNNHQPNFPVSSITQQGSKYPNTPTTTANGQYQGTSSPSYDGITQAAISSFTSTSSSTQFGPQSSQFGTKPSTQFGQSGQQTSTQFGYSETHKPIVQSQTQFDQSSSSQTSDSSQSPTQQYQGTIYQYNKPATTLPAQGNKDSSSSFAQATFSQTNSQAKPVKTETGSKFGIQHSSSQFGSQSTFQTGSNAPTSQFGQKPIVSSLVSGSKNQFGSSGSQFGQKPLTTQGSTNSPNTQGQTSFGQKPVGSSQTTSQFGSIGSQIGSNTQSSQGSGQKPLGSTNQQTQFSSQFGLKPTQGSSFTYSQSTSQTPQFGKKPDSTTQFGTSGSQIGHSSQFGSSGSQFSQNAQSTFGSGSVSSTTKPSFSQKPFGSSNQQTQFGTTGSQFGQNVQSSLGTGSISSTGKPSFGSSYQQTQFGSKPQTTQGSSFTHSQSTSQTSQFEKKPVITTQTGVPSQQTQFGSSGAQFSQNTQSTFGSGSVSSTTKPSFSQKPFSSSNQQTQFGSTGSQFGQNVQSSSGTGSISSTGKPSFGSSYQQTQFGSKPQTTQGSSFTYSQSTSQTSQFEKKPVITTQTGVPSQQTQFGSSGAQFSQNTQSTFGSGSVSSTTKPSFSQKPFGSSNQQSQFGSTGSQFGQNVQSSLGTGSISSTGKPSFGSSYQQTQFGSKPQTTQGSSFTHSQSTSQTSQFEKKPVITTQTGVASQHTQFGSSGAQFSQNTQSTFGSGSVSSTTKPSFSQKPFGSSNQQTQFGSTGSQFGQNVQSSLGTGSISSTGKPSFGSSYQQTQFGSKPQTTQGSSFTYSQSTSQTSQFEKKPVISTQTGVPSQQTQFGSSGAQFSQNTQSTFGSGSVSSTTKPSFSQKPFGSSNQQSQFGSTGSQFGQNVQSSLGTGSISSTGKPSFGSSYQQTQFGSKPQTTQGSSSTYSQSTSQTSQFEKKPVITTQTGVPSQQTQFGSSGSQFSQNAQSTFGSGSVSSTTKPSFSQKPFGSSNQQTQFGSTGSQFGQSVQSSLGSGSISSTGKPSFGSSYQQTQFGSKPQTTQGSSSTYSQSTSQTSQFEKKPVITTQTGVPSQQTQFGSSGSQFSQNAQSTFGSGSVSSTTKPSFSQKPFGSSNQQTQFGSTGSQFGQNGQSFLGTGLVSSTGKPSFDSSYQQTQFGSKPQTTQGSSYTYSQSQTSQYGNKPVISTTQTATQQSQFGSTGTQVSQALTPSKPSFGQKPFGSSSQQTLSGSTSSGSQFDQNSHSIQGVGSTSTNSQTSFGIKPVYQQAQFGSAASQNSQGQTSQFGKKPVSTTHTLQQSQFGSSGSQVGQNSPFGQSGSQFGQNAQPTQGSGADLSSSKPVNGQQPYGSSYQQTQFGSSVSQFGENIQSFQGLGSVSTTFKPTFGQASFGSSSQQTQFGSQFGKKSSQGSSSTSNIYSQSQTSQFGKKPETSQTGSAFQQNQFGSTGSQFGQKPLTNTVTGLTSTTGQASISQSPSSTAQGGSFSQQSHFGSIGSHLNQKPQTATQGPSYVTNTESKGPVVQTTQFGITDSSQNGPSSQSIQYGSGNKLSGSASDSEFNLQQTQLAGSSGSQFGHTTQTAQGIISQVQPVQTTQYGIKPFDSSQNTQGSTQFGSTPSRLSDSSQTAAPIVTTISQTVQPTQFGQKPFQNEFGSTAGQFGQKPQAQANAFASSGNVVPFGITQTGQGFVSSTQKPLGSYLSQTNYQKVQQTQSNFNSAVSTLQKPINNQPLKPVGFSSTQGSIQQLQSTVSSSQFGTQSAKPAEVSGSVIQTSYNQLSGQPFQPASTASTHGSNAQSSAVFTSQSGLQSSQPAVTTHFDRKPLGSSSTQRPSFGSQTLVGSKPNPSVFSGGQASSVLSGVGSHVGPVVSTVQTPIVSGPGYDIVTSNQGGAHGFVGLGEQFGGPREPPSFDEKTGYHY